MREEGKTFHVLCASIAPDYARMKDDFSAVMLLPDRTKPTGGRVDEGSKGASHCKDSAGRERGRGMAEERGMDGKAPQRATWSQHKQTYAQPTGRDDGSRATALQGHSHGRATRALQAQQDAPPPHPSRPHPFAGGHSSIQR